MASKPSLGGYVATVVTGIGFAALFALALFSAGGVAAILGIVGFLVVACVVLVVTVDSLVRQWLTYAIESDGLPPELAPDD
ncbi:hypothetical protein [Halarchaeum nitratireducens]|uniref:Uncharacterized protein n=1 Tax=Halarchaeum nitratireducens TaxID=489913 RepID=A0A830GA69_9EURY|nr:MULTISPECIES: hypothetical protein [Halarchaeum]MBP2249875.1 putative membrane protein [Halarchaeum solikamskense]GGN10036.1 hypothetical protein GCM10009021_07190 [Halarchaeum nitratireducens]